MVDPSGGVAYIYMYVYTYVYIYIYVCGSQLTIVVSPHSAHVGRYVFSPKATAVSIFFHEIMYRGWECLKPLELASAGKCLAKRADAQCREC